MIEPTMDYYTAAATLKRFPLLSLLLVTVVSSALEAPSGVGAPSLISSVDER
jgi:hypothetical protein